MSSTTPNIGLTLPTGTEGWKRSVINGNFTILDTKIGAVGNTSLQSQINTLNSQLTPTALTSATDFNTLTGTSDGKTTLYSGSNISAMSNIPSYFSGQTWPFIIEVRKIAQYAQQILHVYSSTAIPVDTWIRNQSYINGAVGWLGWEQIALKSQIKVKKLTLGSSVSTSGGNFMLEFNAAETGYTPVSVISWNLQDRGQGGKVFITGFLINGNTAQVYGATNTAVTFNTAMTIDVLYMAN